ncbi:MAG: hypothetical protein NVS3B12_22190 [Acidimicrobiales bacterium]
MELASPHIHRPYLRSVAVEQHVGEPTRRRAGIEASATVYTDGEPLEGGIEFDSPTAHPGVAGGGDDHRIPRPDETGGLVGGSAGDGHPAVRDGQLR